MMMKVKVGTYSRRVLIRAFGWEIAILTWPSGTCSKKHDHSVWGVVIPLDGEVFEIPDGGKGTCYGAGQGVLDVRKGSIHTVGNVGRKTAHTLHAYHIGDDTKLRMNYFEHTAKDAAALAKLKARFVP
ncbi:MAG: hypothetical protein ABSD20_02860 [Terriglobales bacterium]